MAAFLILYVACILFELFPASDPCKWLPRKNFCRLSAVFCLQRMCAVYADIAVFETSLWILALSTITIFWLAPYNHPNLHMTKEELAASRHMARLTVLILDMALILSLSTKFYAFASGIVLGLGFTAFLLIVAHGKQKFEKGDM